MQEKKSKLPMVAGFVAAAAASFLVIPPIVTKVSSKLYRAQNDATEIDFDNMGPEIVRKSDGKKDEE